MRRFALPFAVGVIVLLHAGRAAADEPKPAHSAVAEAPRKDGGWTARHESFNQRVKQGNVDLLFIGDSITHDWEGRGKEAWQKHYAKRNAVNLGIGGDRTQHVLWRLANGNLYRIQPKAAVLMIGTNNSNGKEHTAEEIGEGIQAVVKRLREKLPETKVLVLAIFPRGERPNPQREKNAQASEIASKLADDKMVFYLDIGPKFLEADGTLSKDIMYDHLHLTSKGYEIWAEAIEATLSELMEEDKSPAAAAKE